ncbi:MAG TPA: VOC family protein, partial [Ramlibacter sp.]|nr:VOC family protein [Ramlibacter sp.]
SMPVKTTAAKRTGAKPKIKVARATPCLWFDGEAEQAAEFYTSVFAGSRIKKVQHYGEAGPGKKGSVMLVEATVAGQDLMLLNGGPEFPQTEAFSLHLACKTQEEIDTLWEGLSEGGSKSVCGWVKDRWGVSWQVEWAGMDRLMAKDPATADRVFAAMLKMTKIDIAELKAAAKGA